MKLLKNVISAKPPTHDTVWHAKRELGDIMWYWINACRALDLDPNDVPPENVNKLKSKISPVVSLMFTIPENPKEGDPNARA